MRLIVVFFTQTGGNGSFVRDYFQQRRNQDLVLWCVFVCVFTDLRSEQSQSAAD